MDILQSKSWSEETTFCIAEYSLLSILFCGQGLGFVVSCSTALKRVNCWDIEIANDPFWKFRTFHALISAIITHNYALVWLIWVHSVCCMTSTLLLNQDACIALNWVQIPHSYMYKVGVYHCQFRIKIGKIHYLQFLVTSKNRNTCLAVSYYKYNRKTMCTV